MPFILLTMLLMVLIGSLAISILFWKNPNRQLSMADNSVRINSYAPLDASKYQLSRAYFIQTQQEKLNSILSELALNGEDRLWPEFQVCFNILHDRFYDQLNYQFPNLSAEEKRFCAFLHLRLDTNQIASITKQSPAKVAESRARLKAKIQESESSKELQYLLKSVA